MFAVLVRKSCLGAIISVNVGGLVAVRLGSGYPVMVGSYVRRCVPYCFSRVAQTRTAIMAVLTAKITVLKAVIRAGVMDGANDRMKQSPDSTMAVKVITPMNSSVPTRCQFIYSGDRGDCV